MLSQAWTEAASPDEMVGDAGEDESELRGWGGGESASGTSSPSRRHPRPARKPPPLKGFSIGTHVTTASGTAATVESQTETEGVSHDLWQRGDGSATTTGKQSC